MPQHVKSNQGRFSKSVLRTYINEQIEALTVNHNLERLHANGTAQLRGKPEDIDRCVAYGKREALAALIEEFRL